MAKQIKYINSAVLVLLACLCFLCIPASATAPTEDNPIESTEVSVLDELQYAIDGLLTKYLGSPAISIDEMKLIVNEMDWETYQTARWEISELSSSMTSMVDSGIVTLEALHQLLDNNTLLGEFDAALNAKAASDNSVSTYATNLSLYGGNLSITDDNGSSASGEESSGVTIKTTGNMRTTKTNTITFTNNTSTAKVLKFDYSVSGNYDSYSFSNASGSSVEVTLAANGGTYTCSVTAKKYMTSTATLTLSNFSFEDAASSSSITINFDSSMGSVTVGGNSATSGVAFNDISTTTETAIVATCGSGTTFLGWINEATNTFLSTSASYSQIFGSDVVLTAAFAKSDGSSSAYWGVGAIKEDKTLASDLSYIYSYSVPEYSAIFDDLSEAYAYADSSANKAVVLLASGTLPAGDYTIPAGVTLLIPYDSANTLCTNKPTLVETYTTPSAYRTLTMTNGANITVNGTISISGNMSSKWAYHGMPTGPLGFLQMNSGSTITVNNGGTLYAWGYIKGSGNVTVNSGGTVYECFQLPDFRGGDATSNMTSDTNANTYGVFPFNQYYVQNVEVPMTLYAGANDKGFLAVHVTLVGIQSAEVPFIGTDCMFSITDGYIVKDYREGTGRTDLKIYGDVALSPITLNMKVTTLGSVTIESEKYELPIPNHYSIYLESGRVTINQNVALLPGSEVYIRNDTSCVLGEGVSAYVYDLAQWGTSEISYASRECYQYEALPYVPGGNGTVGRLKDALLQVDGTLDASKGYIYVTEDGANICSTGSGVVKTTPGTETITYQVIQYLGISADADDTDIQYVAIPITPAKLLNSNSTYTETTGASSTTYKYINGFWHKGGACTSNADDGDCTTPIKCSVCGAETTAANAEHSWDDGTVTVVATSTTPGVMTYTCTATGCTKTKTEEIPATGGGEELPVYSVTITWSQTSTAKYTEGQTSYKWNTSDLKYTAETTAGGWNNTTSVVEITIDNSNSTGGVEAGFGYTATVGGSASWSGLTDSKLPVAAAGTGKATLTVTPTGDPGDLTNGASITLGTITITLTKEES